MKYGYPFDLLHLNKPNNLKLYRELAEYYFAIEEVTRNIDQEINFLLDYFPKDNFSRLVDLGCGTGEHANMLRNREYNVLGIDSSNHMLRIARRRFPSIRVIQDDLTKMTFTGVYDGFLCLFGTMNYIMEDMVLKKAIRGVHQRLRQKGRFIVDVWNAEPIKKIKNKPMTNVSSIIYDKKVIHRNRGFNVLENESMTLVKVNYLYQVDDMELDDCHYMRAFELSELEKIFSNNGFQILSVFKNFRREDFETFSSRIVMVLEKT